MEYISLVVAVWTLLVLLTTLRMALSQDMGQPPKNALLKLLTHWGWLAPMTLVAATLTGAIISGDLSVSPISAYFTLAEHYDRSAGIAAAFAVTALIIWVLWMPAKIYLWLGGGSKDHLKLKIHSLSAIMGMVVLLPW